MRKTAKEIRAIRPDYGKQLEVLISYLYHHFVNPGDHVVDGGANAGAHTIPLSNLVTRQGRVYAIEPIPKMIEYLKQRLSKYGVPNAVEIYPNALGDHAFTADFIFNVTQPALSHIRYFEEPIPTDSPNIRHFAAPVLRLDDILAGVTHVSFFKSDLEGADFLGIRGGASIITRDRPIIVFENTRALAAKQYGYSADDFFTFFDTLEYQLFDMNNFRLTRDTWAADYLSHEVICGPAGRLMDRARSLIDGFWDGLDHRRIINTWQEASDIYMEPFVYVTDERI